jgi:hypothetical protein
LIMIAPVGLPSRDNDDDCTVARRGSGVRFPSAPHSVNRQCVVTFPILPLIPFRHCSLQATVYTVTVDGGSAPAEGSPWDAPTVASRETQWSPCRRKRRRRSRRTSCARPCFWSGSDPPPHGAVLEGRKECEVQAEPCTAPARTGGAASGRPHGGSPRLVLDHRDRRGATTTAPRRRARNTCLADSC